MAQALEGPTPAERARRETLDRVAAEIKSPHTDSGLGVIYLDMVLEYYDQIRLDGIWSNAERGKGLARKAMKILLESADKYQIRIRLLPQRLTYNLREMSLSKTEKTRLMALDAQGLSDKQLFKWYLRLGFEDDGGGFGGDNDEGGLMLYVPERQQRAP